MTRSTLLITFFYAAAVSAFAPLPQPQGMHRVATSSASQPFDVTESSPTPDIPRNTNSNLPEIPGDYDWDAKYAGDADWVTDSVPGKTRMNEIDLARQATALNALEEKWRRERELQEYEESKKVGFVPQAEMINGRTAMFFLVTGLLTELWTGVSMPGQVEEFLRVTGVIGFDG